MREAKARGKIVRDDAAGLDDELGRKLLEDFPQRQMDRHRHDGELRRPQHHHRPQRLAGRLLHQLGQEFGMAGLGKAPIVEHVLGDGLVTTAAAAPAMTSATARRIEATAAGALDRSGRPGSAVTATSRGTNRQRRAKCRGGRRRRHGGDRHVESELSRRAAREIRGRRRYRMAAGRVRRAAARSRARGRDRSRRARRASMPKVARCLLSMTRSGNSLPSDLIRGRNASFRKDLLPD